MTCDVTLVGGPADGTVRQFPGDMPPATVVVSTFGSTVMDPTRWRQVEHTYERWVNPADDGTTWILRHEGSRVLP